MTDPDYRGDLARIENNLDRVENAIVSLARMEERMVTLLTALTAMIRISATCGDVWQSLNG